MNQSSSSIKRQILKDVKIKPIREKITHRNDTDRDGEIIERGNAFEKMIATEGWQIVEAFLINKMDLMGLAVDDKSGDIEKGVARGYIALLKYIELTIDERDKILEKENLKYAKTKDVSKSQKSP